MMLRRAFGAALMAALITLGGCAADGERPPVAQLGEGSQAANTNVTQQEYRIGVDDRVQVNVWRDEELSVDMPVRPDGRISMPLIGDVVAGGRTPEEVSREIEMRLAKYVRTPQVTVIVAELRSHQFLSRVRVTGAVRQPVSVSYQPGMTALDAILEAGGVNEYAAPDRTTLYRRGGEEQQVVGIRLGDILTKGDLSSNVPLRPGDVITVPERLF